MSRPGERGQCARIWWKSERQRPKLSLTYTAGTPALRARQHGFCALQVKGVDHVDDEQRDPRFIGRVAVPVAALTARAGHLERLPTRVRPRSGVFRPARAPYPWLLGRAFGP